MVMYEYEIFKLRLLLLQGAIKHLDDKSTWLPNYLLHISIEALTLKGMYMAFVNMVDWNSSLPDYFHDGVLTGFDTISHNAKVMRQYLQEGTAHDDPRYQGRLHFLGRVNWVAGNNHISIWDFHALHHQI